MSRAARTPVAPVDAADPEAGRVVSGRTADLTPSKFPTLRWDAASRTGSLTRLQQYVSEECEHAIRWYYVHRKRKKLMGVALRTLAVICAAIAGVVPVSEAFTTVKINPALSTVFLAVAAVLTLLDRFGGATSGWVRYMKTAAQLKTLQGNFQLDCEEHRFDSAIHIEDPEHVKKGIQLCREFLEDVNLAVQAETSSWAHEFQLALTEAEGLYRAKPGGRGAAAAARLPRAVSASIARNA